MGGLWILADERVVYRVRAQGDSEYSYSNNLRFILSRQDRIYEKALAELREGKKTTCWMWYIFPGLRALAKSRKAFVFSLQGPHDARGYLAHPVLGPRIKECCEILLTHKDKSAKEIFGETDAAKLHTSMTLFAYACGEKEPVFQRVLAQFFNGAPEYVTLTLLKKDIIVWEFTK